MSLNFQNISTLSLQQQSRFFQAGFNYANVKNISINGLLVDLKNSFGITGIWTGIDSTNKGATDYAPLIINGVNFGSGRILNISYDDGNDVRLKGYTADIEVLESGDFSNFGGTYYKDIDFVNPQYLESFDEAWDFSKKPNGGYSYSHNASITFTTGVGNLNAIDSAKTLAKTLFTGSNLGFAFYSGYSNKQGKRFFTESYNLINKSCSFSESFDFDADNGPYSSIKTHSVNLDADGIVVASERCEIKGIENPNYQKALAALNGELAGSYDRCNEVVLNYFPTGATLINAPLSQSRYLDLFSNNLRYEISFNNSPNNLLSYFWDYTQEINFSDGIATVLENGTILGRRENPTLSFNAAKTAFSTISSGAASRASQMFASSFGSSTNFLQTKSDSYSPHKGSVSYSRQYSNDPSLIANVGIRRKEIIVENNQPIYKYNLLGIINERQMAQDDRQSTNGTQTVNVSMQGDRTVSFGSFLSSANSSINIYSPNGDGAYLVGAQCSYSPGENSFNANASWVYNKAAQKGIL